MNFATEVKSRVEPVLGNENIPARKEAQHEYRAKERASQAPEVRLSRQDIGPDRS